MKGTSLTEEPLLSICLGGSRKHYSAGEELIVEYQIDAIDVTDIQAVEASVLWLTEGKGEEDLGVHFFERRLPADAEEGDLRPLRRFKIMLPNSPLSYEGAIMRIRWCVRLRLFARRGKEYVLEHGFTLGSVPPAPVPPPEQATDED
ncbi:hypothetical protein ETAA8_64090 [Anatilimnocola aggregata]|uniref:Uncharacterized protein n=1 Tax=Anatilimnocola aggregata TaxID=2528021 RepID=A0A517YM09_9BACT|nr:hypothetical protein [Anatilimnocola aggregata]QDU31256.1 hypothetical protein ETAA8_64090 [Anatilimnocola aggregata]